MPVWSASYRLASEPLSCSAPALTRLKLVCAKCQPGATHRPPPRSSLFAGFLIMRGGVKSKGEGLRGARDAPTITPRSDHVVLYNTRTPPALRLPAACSQPTGYVLFVSFGTVARPNQPRSCLPRAQPSHSLCVFDTMSQIDIKGPYDRQQAPCVNPTKGAACTACGRSASLARPACRMQEQLAGGLAHNCCYRTSCTCVS